MNTAIDRADCLSRVSKAIKDNVLSDADFLSIAVQAGAKKQKINHNYNLGMFCQKSALKSASKFVTNICESGSKENCPPQPEVVLEGLKSVRKRLLVDEEGMEILRHEGQHAPPTSLPSEDLSHARLLFCNIVSDIDKNAQSMVQEDVNHSRLDLSHVYDNISDIEEDETEKSQHEQYPYLVHVIKMKYQKKDNLVHDISPQIDLYDKNIYDYENHNDNASLTSKNSARSRYSTSCSLAQVSEDAHRHLLQILYEGDMSELYNLRGIGRVRAQRLVNLQDDGNEENNREIVGEEHARDEIIRRLEAVGMNQSSIQRFLKENLANLLLDQECQKISTK